MSNIKTYQIPFAYEHYGRISVEATSLVDAYSMAEDKLAEMTVEDMDAVSEYLDNSEEIDMEGIALDEDGNIIDE